MIIVRAPIRLSFAGGGTDLPAYYEQYGGLVVSTTIDKYFYVFLNLSGRDHVQLTSSDYRAFYRHRSGEAPVWDGDLGLVKAALHEFRCEDGIGLFLASEIPPGTGLGSSGAVAVALVKALSTLQGRRLTPAQVAECACTLELDKLRAPIGKQDQYAAAHGGFNAFSFSSDGVDVEPLAISPDTIHELEQNLLLFFTGATRSANTILREQQRATAQADRETIAALHFIKEAAAETRRCFERGDLNAFGKLLGETWERKKCLADGISTGRVDELYALARERGATGGKLAGAGGGGFLMLYCERLKQRAVTDALEAAGLYRMDYHFERGGAQVLMNSLPRPRPMTVLTDDMMRYA